LSDGQQHVLGVAVLVGRDPSADQRWPGAAIVVVVDSSKTVSKTHAAFEVDFSGLWVTDLQSSNGVFVEHADGYEVDAEPGKRTAVPPGATVLLGEFAITAEKS